MLAFATLALVVLLDVELGSTSVISATYPLAAVLAAALVSVRGTATVAAVAVTLAALAGLWNDNFGARDWVLRLALAAGLSAIALFAATIRVRREQAL